MSDLLPDSEAPAPLTLREDVQAVKRWAERTDFTAEEYLAYAAARAADDADWCRRQARHLLGRDKKAKRIQRIGEWERNAASNKDGIALMKMSMTMRKEAADFFFKCEQIRSQPPDAPNPDIEVKDSEEEEDPNDQVARLRRMKERADGRDAGQQ